MLEGEKVLVTGVTGQVALPVATALAPRNEVWGTSRFSDAPARERLEAAGVRCAPADFVSGDFSSLPDDFTCVLHFAVMRANDWEGDLDGNVGELAFLMEHCQRARAFLHCSSTAVYQPSHTNDPFKETDP